MIDGIFFIYVSIITVCAFALFVNAEETERFVLLMMLETVLMTPFTAMLAPTVNVPLLLATLNLVFVPMTKIEALATLIVPEIVFAEVVEILIVLAAKEVFSFKSA
jgi:hypothetical protein